MSGVFYKEDFVQISAYQCTHCSFRSYTMSDMIAHIVKEHKREAEQ